MLVRDYMTTHVHSARPDTSLSDAMHLMREKNIKHLPVLHPDSSLAGVVSDRDMKAYAPSKGTSLDIYEINYLLAKTEIRQVMRKKVVTARPDMPVEDAALIMLDKGVGCLPVLEGGKLAGIISDADIFRVLIEVTGVRGGGHRVSALLDDKPGSIKVLGDVIRSFGFRIQSILSTSETSPAGKRYVVIRTRGTGDFSAMKAALSDPATGVTHVI